MENNPFLERIQETLESAEEFMSSLEGRCSREVWNDMYIPQKQVRAALGFLKEYAKLKKTKSS